MMLLEKWQENEDRVRQMGVEAITRARAAGVPSYYMDPSVGDGIIKEMPDGTRILLDPSVDEEKVLKTLGPRS